MGRVRRWLSVIWLRGRSVVRNRAVDRELEKELAFHLEQQVEEYLAGGMSRAEAEHAARRLLGGVAQIQEECRDMRRVNRIEQVVADISYALRGLRRSRAFTVTAVVSLALGIGANTAIFSLMESMLLRPLPYAEPERLYWATITSREIPAGLVLTPQFAAWRLENSTFSGMAAWNDTQYNLTGVGEADRLSGALVNADFFRVLGVRPAAGRDFALSEDQAVPAKVAMLGYELWQRHFGGDARWVGRTIALNDAAYTVIGIVPEGFRFPGNLRPEIYVPGGLSGAPRWKALTLGWMRVVGRLKPGFNVERAIADLDLIQRRHEGDLPPGLGVSMHERLLQVRPLQRELVGDLRPVLLLLAAAVGLVLLMTCANVAGLQLARGAARGGEMAIRAALGGSRGRLLSLMFSESLVLALVGGAIGLALARMAIPLMSKLDLLRLPTPHALRLNPTVLLFAFGVTLATAVACGLAPAFAASRANCQEALEGSGRSVAGGWSGQMRSVLVAGEIAIALVLLLGAGLLAKSMAILLRQNLGMQPSGLLTLRLRLPESRYGSAGKQRAFVEELVRRARGLPGVESAAITNALPLAGYSEGRAIFFEGQPVMPLGLQPTSPLIAITPDYFRAMRVPLLGGRLFTEDDGPGAPPVAIVNLSFAQRFLGKRDPIGQRFRWEPSAKTWVTIVGLVGDVRHRGPAAEAMPEAFTPVVQHPASSLGLVLRSSIPPESLASPIRAEIRGMDRELPVYDVATMQDRVGKSTERERFEFGLVGAFAALSVLLAVTGVYGVTAYAVGQRTREFGVRMALGAAPGQIASTVMGRGLVLAVCGILPGLAGGWALTRLIASLLYRVEARDLGVFVGATVILVVAVVAASLVPARRASRIDPVVALRWE